MTIRDGYGSSRIRTFVAGAAVHRGKSTEHYSQPFSRAACSDDARARAAKFGLGNWLIEAVSDVARSCFTPSRSVFPIHVSLIIPEDSFNPSVLCKQCHGSGNMNSEPA